MEATLAVLIGLVVVVVALVALFFYGKKKPVTA